MINERILNELRGIFSPAGVVTEYEKVKEQSFDKCPWNVLEKDPENIGGVVVIPHPQNYPAQLVSLVQWAEKHGKKIVVRGGGSGGCRAVVPRKGADTVIVDLTTVDNIFEVNPEEKYVIVGAGIYGDRLEEFLNKRFRHTLGHSPASLAISTPGGWVAARSSGQFSARYGNIDDLVLGLEVITGKGEVLWIEKDKLSAFLGMEGTTGIITKVKMKIFPFSRHRSFLVFSFPFMKWALAMMSLIFRQRPEWEKDGVYVSAVRLYDFWDYHFVAKPYKAEHQSKNSVSRFQCWQYRLEGLVARKACWVNAFLRLLEKFGFYRSYMIVALESEDNKKLQAVAEQLRFSLKALGDIGREEDSKIGQTWYDDRYKLQYEKAEWRFEQGLLLDTFDCRPKSVDGTFEVYQAVRESLQDVALAGAHVGMDRRGSYLYFTLVGSAGNLAARKRLYQEIWWERMIPACIRSGGFTTHHHGIGWLKAGKENRLINFCYGEEWHKSVALPAKKQFDPGNIFNPGNLV